MIKVITKPETVSLLGQLSWPCHVERVCIRGSGTRLQNGIEICLDTEDLVSDPFMSSRHGGLYLKRRLKKRRSLDGRRSRCRRSCQKATSK